MKSKKANEYIEEWTFDAADLVDADGVGDTVVRRGNALKAVEIAEMETEERMISKAHKIVEEMMNGIFKGAMPRKIAYEFIQKMNDDEND